MNTLEKSRAIVNQAGHQAWQEKVRRSGFFFGAVLLHLILFLMVATWVIFQPPQQEQESRFGQVKSIPVKVPPPPQPPSSGQTAYNPQFEPQAVVVPVVTPPSVITTVNTTFTVDSTKIINQALSHLPSAAPQGTGMNPGTSGGGGGGGAGSVYGSGTGNASDLVGYLYDLKQTPDRKPTSMMNSTSDGLNFLRSFVKTWDMGTLENYYKAPNPLYATQIMIPERHSEESTKAFGVDGVVEAKRWIIVYEGKVIPPESGTFRFVGWADDFLAVRWNGANVLDASYPSEELDPSADSEKISGRDGDQTFKCGNWIQMVAGEAVPIQILIGEGPGGYSGFLLMVQKQGDDSQSGDLPVFQLRDGPIPDVGKDPKLFKKKMVFQPAP